MFTCTLSWSSDILWSPWEAVKLVVVTQGLVLILIAWARYSSFKLRGRLGDNWPGWYHTMMICWRFPYRGHARLLMILLRIMFVSCTINHSIVTIIIIIISIIIIIIVSSNSSSSSCSRSSSGSSSRCSSSSSSYSNSSSSSTMPISI